MESPTLTLEQIDEIEERARSGEVTTGEVIFLAVEARKVLTRSSMVARELLTAAQHERSRLATADHQRDLADRWLDIARSSLPGPPTVSDMAGSFEHGPDSVEWLREQRATRGG